MKVTPEKRREVKSNIECYGCHKKGGHYKKELPPEVNKERGNRSRKENMA